MLHPAFYIPELEDGDFFASGRATRCKGDCASFPPEHRHALISLKALEIAAFGVFKADDMDPLDFDEAETAIEGWVQFEYGLAVLLARLYKDKAKKLAEIVEPFLTPEGEAFDFVSLDAAAREADVEVRAELRESLTEPVRKLVKQTIGFGEAKIVSGILNGISMVDVVSEALTTSTVHYSETFFTAHVLPALYREIEATLAEPLSRPNLQPILQTLRDRLQGEAYWSVVANATASRAFHYGYLRAAEIQGYTKVVFSAIIDNKTSEVCEHLNGKTWFLAAMVRKYEAAAQAQTTEDLKAVAPWFKRTRGVPLDDDVRAFLQAGGVPCPPLHGLCRSSLIVM